MTLDSFLTTAWSEHAESPEDVADRIAASVPLVATPEQVAPFLGLAVHVYGKHLGRWQRGVELLESLRGLPAVDTSADPAGAIARGVAAQVVPGAVRGASQGGGWPLRTDLRRRKEVVRE